MAREKLVEIFTKGARFFLTKVFFFLWVGLSFAKLFFDGVELLDVAENFVEPSGWGLGLLVVEIFEFSSYMGETAVEGEGVEVFEKLVVGRVAVALDRALVAESAREGVVAK